LVQAQGPNPRGYVRLRALARLTLVWVLLA
jgi:hypothetical protein